jgi:carbonic anhydrase
MEIHFVHAGPQGKLAVVAVMVEEGAANTQLAALWNQMPEAIDEKHALKSPVDISGLLPQNRAYYRFTGSLTTPPCSEGVTWLVMKNPITASKDQIDRLPGVLHHSNNRPVQALNGREIDE